MPEQRRLAWLNAMPWLFVLIWSTGFIVARYGMPNSPPFTFLLWRYVFSILCFVLWVKWARVPWPQGRAQWWHLAVTGVLMHAGYLGGVWAAVKVGMGAGLTAGGGDVGVVSGALSGCRSGPSRETPAADAVAGGSLSVSQKLVT